MQLLLSYTRADFNALASLVVARHFYPQGRVYLVGRPEPKTRDFIAAHQERLNVEYDVDYHNEPVELVVLVGVREPYRLGKFSDLVTQPYVPVHIYDNHPPTHQSIVGDQELIERQGTTVTVLLKKLLAEGGRLDPFEATLCLLALCEETDSLTYLGTTAEDVEMVAQLMRWGGRLEAVSALGQRRLTLGQRRLIENLLNNLHYQNVGGRQVLFTWATTEEHIDDLTAVAERVMELEHPEVLFCLVNMEQRSYLAARSLPGGLDVSAILRELGGAGHSTSAFACVKKRPLAVLREELLTLLEARAPRALCARDLMSSPVAALELTPKMSVAQASQEMQKLGHSAVCVCAQGRFVGLVARADLDKALGHQLGEELVVHYLHSEGFQLRPSTPIAEVGRIVSETPLGCAPVLEGEELVGIVSKSDVLRALNNFISTEYVPSRPNLVPVEFLRLKAEYLTLLKNCGEIGESLNLKTFAVGGFVRDMLLNIANNDIDLVVEGDGLAFAKVLAQKLGGNCRVHENFATAQVALPNGLKLDVATARTETYTRPAALPDVQGSSLKQDLYRRDFSINAMALQLAPDSFGQLIDFFGSRADLEKGVVRILHNLSFVDDPTRIFRAIKFEQRYGFHMDRNTQHLLLTAVGMGLVKMVTPERLGHELWQIMQEPAPRHSLVRLDELRVLGALEEGLEVAPALSKQLEECELLVNEYSALEGSERLNQGLIYLNLLLLANLEVAQIRAFLKKYALFPSLVAKMLLWDEPQRAALLGQLRNPHLSNCQLVSLLRAVPSAEALLVLAAGAGEEGEVWSPILRYLLTLRQVEAPLKGSDLIRLGYKPGPQFSQILAWLLDERLEERLEDKERAERAVLEKFPLK